MKSFLWCLKYLVLNHSDIKGWNVSVEIVKMIVIIVDGLNSNKTLDIAFLKMRIALELNLWHVRFQILLATGMEMTVFWDVALCSLVQTGWHFRSTYCFHHEGGGDGCSNNIWNISQFLSDYIGATSRKTIMLNNIAQLLEKSVKEAEAVKCSRISRV
jgi:hypothetical protein